MFKRLFNRPIAKLGTNIRVSRSARGYWTLLCTWPDPNKKARFIYAHSLTEAMNTMVRHIEEAEECNHE